MNDIVSLLRIHLTTNIGPITFHELYKKYKDPNQIIKQIQKNAKYTIPSVDYAENQISKMRKFGAECIFYNDQNYPHKLKQIDDAPPFIFVRGNKNLLNMKSIAIVGARNSSIYGNKIAYNFAQGLMKVGYTIISGMARGIDRNAHIGGIKQTIAVFGNGLDIIYPEENRDIYNDILKNNGLHVSESILGTEPTSFLFPMRNRIIAGLADAILVIEASPKSGSLITANFGIDYNRDVFVVPGSPLEQRYRGSNALIQKGAYLVQDYEEICNEMNTYIEHHNAEHINETSNSISFTQQEILSLIGQQNIHIDSLSAAITAPIHLLKQTLALMEIEGLVQQVAPGVFARTL